MANKGKQTETLQCRYVSEIANLETLVQSLQLFYIMALITFTSHSGNSTIKKLETVCICNNCRDEVSAMTEVTGAVDFVRSTT